MWESVLTISREIVCWKGAYWIGFERTYKTPVSNGWRFKIIHEFGPVLHEN